MDIPCAQVSDKPKYTYTKAKTGLLEPVVLTGSPSPSVKSTSPVIALPELPSRGHAVTDGQG